MALAYWLIPIALVLLHFLSDFTRKTLKRLPPGPTPLPIVGNMFSMVDLPHLTFMKLAKKYGPVMSFRIGVNTFVILTSPELAREAFQTKDKALSDRWAPDYVHAFNHKELSMMFLNSSSPLFKQLRGVGANLVSPRNLDSSRFGREAKMLDLVRYFRNHAGKPLRINFPVFTNMINVISAVLFSEDMVDLNSDSIQEFRDLVMAQIVDPAAPNITYLFPILRPLDLHGARAFGQKLYTQYYAFFDEIINRRRKVETTDDTRPKDFLDYLLELHAENKLELKVIKAFFSDVFGAGAHTSSVVFEWAMAELLHNPDKLAKVLAELKANIGTRQVEETDLMNLPYLQAVVKETMRKHPVAPLLLPHVVSESGVEIGGYSIPKGSQVMVNVYALARDPKIWPEPEVFRPERFLENKMDVRGQNFEVIPFGSGRRICPGVPLVLRMLPLFLATLFQAFEWQLPDGMKPSEMDMTEKFEAAVALNTPLVAIPVPVSGLDY